MASFVYTKWIDKLGKLSGTGSNFDMDADTFKVGLSSTTHVPSQANHEFVDMGDGATDNFSDGEPNGTGYTGGHAGAGRQTLASRSWAITGSTKVMLDAADIVWTGFNAGSIRQATLMKEGAANTSDNLICNVEFSGTVTPGGSDFTITWAATGIFYGT